MTATVETNASVVVSKQFASTREAVTTIKVGLREGDLGNPSTQDALRIAKENIPTSREFMTLLLSV